MTGKDICELIEKNHLEDCKIYSIFPMNDDQTAYQLIFLDTSSPKTVGLTTAWLTKSIVVEAERSIWDDHQ